MTAAMIEDRIEKGFCLARSRAGGDQSGLSRAMVKAEKRLLLVKVGQEAFRQKPAERIDKAGGLPEW